MRLCMYDVQGTMTCYRPSTQTKHQNKNTEHFESVCTNMTYYETKPQSFQIDKTDLPKVQDNLFTLSDFQLLNPSPHNYEARTKADIMNLNNPTMMYQNHAHDPRTTSRLWITYKTVGDIPDMPSHAMVKICK